LGGKYPAGAPAPGPPPAAEPRKPNALENMWTGMTSPFTKGKIMCVGVRKANDDEIDTKKEEENSDEKPDVSMQWLVMFWSFMTSPFAAMNKGDHRTKTEMAKEMAKKLSFSKSQPPGADDVEIDETAAEVAAAAVKQALKAAGEDGVLSEDEAVPKPETSGNVVRPKKRDSFIQRAKKAVKEVKHTISPSSKKRDSVSR